MSSLMSLTNSVVVITEFLNSKFQYQSIGKLKEGTEIKWPMDKIFEKKSAAGKIFW